MSGQKLGSNLSSTASLYCITLRKKYCRSDGAPLGLATVPATPLTESHSTCIVQTVTKKKEWRKSWPIEMVEINFRNVTHILRTEIDLDSIEVPWDYPSSPVSIPTIFQGVIHSGEWVRNGFFLYSPLLKSKFWFLLYTLFEGFFFFYKPETKEILTFKKLNCSR